MATAPWWPFGRAVLVPKQRPGQRTQCPHCAGGGEINGLWCGHCDGRGWHDAEHPAPEGD